jgi:predicted enzyme related to lactoylglutathione lyase
MDHTICHFEIPVDDLPRASAFYSGLFGWKLTPWRDDIQMIETVPSDGPGRPAPGVVNGMLIKKQNPQHPFSNYVAVEDIDAYAEKAVALGGRIALPKTAVPGMGWFLYFLDPDGNILGMWQDDPSAQ